MPLSDTLSGLTASIDGALTKIDNQVKQSSVALSRVTADVYPGDSLEFKIANYDSETTYTLSVALGTVNLVVEGLTAKIAYTAPNSPGNETIQINERQIQFPVLARVVVKPTLVSIADGAVDVSTAPTLTSSAFASTPAGYDTHQSTDWQVATDSGFTNLAWQANDAPIELETVTLSEGALVGNTTYYARVRHTGAVLGDSQWSDTVSFTTISTGLTGTEVALLTPPTPVAGDNFGAGVALSGDGSRLAVGTPFDDTFVGNAGAVFVYRNEGGSWVLEATLNGSQAAAGDQAGWNVSISDDGSVLLIGSHLHDGATTNAGGVYVFTRSGTSWSQEARLLPTQSVGANEYFGRSCAISRDGSTIVVGAYMNDTAGSDAGKIYIYRKVSGNWTVAKILTAYDAASSDWFGYSVATSDNGDLVIVGSPNDDDAGNGAGSAYLYRHNGTDWIIDAKLNMQIGNGGGAGDAIGWSVALSGDGNVAYIGATKDDDNGSDAGCLYIFRYNGTNSWDFEAKLVAPAANGLAQFGWSVKTSVDGNAVLVGARYDSYVAPYAGAAYLFKKDGASWDAGMRLIASDAVAYDEFGYSVALNGNGTLAAIGAYMRHTPDPINDAGAVYIFN